MLNYLNGLLLESISSTMILGDHRRCTFSVHRPGRSASAERFSGQLSHFV
jgi:hypothetical protein